MTEAVTPLEQGASGDGIADDTAALRAALGSGASLVTLPPGTTYRTTASVTVPPGVFVHATGATIHAAHGGTALIFAGGGGITGGRIRGPGGRSYRANSIGIACRGRGNAPAAPTYVAGPTVVGTEVAGFGEYGIALEFVRDFVLDHVLVHLCGYAGIAGLSCEEGRVLTPRVHDIGPGSPDDAYGIFFDRRDGGVSEVSDPRSRRIAIVAPDVRRVRAARGNGEGIDSHGGVDITVSGGMILDCQRGVAFVPSRIASAPVLAPVRCRVEGTIIRGNHEGAGIVVSGALGRGGRVVAPALDCVVEGVTVEAHGRPSASGTDGGIVVQATDRLHIARSTITACASHGLYLNLANRALTIVDNMIVDPFDPTYGAPSCIFVQGDGNSGSIHGTVFRHERPARARYVAVNAVRVQPGLSGLALAFGPSAFLGAGKGRLQVTLGTTAGIDTVALRREAAAGS